MKYKIYFLMILLIITGLINFPIVIPQACVCQGHEGQPGCCVGNQGQACGNCGTIDCGGSCSGEGPCSPSSTQCSSNKFQTCSSSCQWENTGTDVDSDIVDQQCEDTTCDVAAGVCDSAVAGKCVVKDTDEICTDSLDNDCNGFADAADSSCNGDGTGVVQDKDGNPIEGVKITVFNSDFVEMNSMFTKVTGNWGPMNLPFGDYTVSASHPDFVPKVLQIFIPPQGVATADFTGDNALVYGQICEADCTYTGDNIIHKECNEIAGCSFYDDKAMEVCDGAKPGWIREYDETNEIECPDGIPTEKVEVKATVSCEKENLIKMTRLVNYQGKLVKMIVVTCG